MNEQDKRADDLTGEPAAPPAEPSAPGTASAPEPEPVAPPSPDETLKLELADLKDRLLRALAEVENTRRRAERDREDAGKYAITGFARGLLSVADNLKRALESVPADVRANNDAMSALHSGVELTERELQNVLARHAIKPIEALGAKFDSTLHQAMFEIADDRHAPSTVLQVLETGYTIGDRLLRPAMVAVAKAAATPEPLAKIDTKV